MLQKKAKHYLYIFIILMMPFICTAQTVSTSIIKKELSIYWNKKERLTGGASYTSLNASPLSISQKIDNDILLLGIKGNIHFDEKSFTGIFFDSIPGYSKGVTIWRYKPWNSWTKPIAIDNIRQMEDWDIQFFYWQYKDGSYGAAVPLSGNGCRTTIGKQQNKWGSKAAVYTTQQLKQVPALAIGFGDDPFELFKRIYAVALKEMGQEINQQSKKKLPVPFQYIGWCTWNASNNGKDLNETTIINSVKTFADHNFPLGWVLIDDGWFRHSDQQLQSFYPDTTKFPNGFKHINQTLKQQYNIKYTGLWHAFNGYWNGIDPNSALGERYKPAMFNWTQKESPDRQDAPLKTYSFIKPGSDSLDSFFDNWYRYFKSEGFDFTKTDNQLVSERMCVNNYPIFSLSKSIHQSLYKASDKYFRGAIINCMDMTADAYLHFGSSAVGRAVEDFFPYKEDETYNMQHGNAPAHITQAIYNSIYFSQMVFPDFDMFQSHHPDAVYHAIARTLNNGPIYLTDVPGQQNFDILDKLVYKDGKCILSSTSLLPAEECLFQVQQPVLFKAFSKAGSKGLLALYNAADTDIVNGFYKAADINGIKGDRFLMYEYFSGKSRMAALKENIAASLGRKGYEIVYVLPLKNNFTALGLINKYNAPSTVLNETWNKNAVTIKLYEGGLFKAYSLKKPLSVWLNGKNIEFNYTDSFISIEIPFSTRPEIELRF